MKTAQEIIEDYDFFFNCHGENTDRHVLSAMEEYADQFKPRWISVEKELPESDSIRVLAYILDGEHSFITTTKTRDGKFYVADPAMKAVVTHWQNLPESPLAEVIGL